MAYLGVECTSSDLPSLGQWKSWDQRFFVISLPQLKRAEILQSLLVGAIFLLCIGD